MKGCDGSNVMAQTYKHCQVPRGHLVGAPSASSQIDQSQVSRSLKQEHPSLSRGSILHNY